MGAGMRWFTSLLDLAGAALVAVGVGLVSIPAACVVAGLGILAVSWRLSSGGES